MRFYSPEWVAAFNQAVAELAPLDVPSGDFALLQVVHGGPSGTVRVGLSVDGGRVTMALDPPEEPAPQVVLSVGYDDAAALARGELEPARLVASGRVKVRGDLSVLVGGQALLVAVAARAASLAGSTEY